MPFLIARAPVRSGRVSAFVRRSRAAVELDSSGERPGPTLKRSGRGGSIDLMPKERFCVAPFRSRGRGLGRRKEGGKGMAIRGENFVGMLALIQKMSGLWQRLSRRCYHELEDAKKIATWLRRCLGATSSG